MKKLMLKRGIISSAFVMAYCLVALSSAFAASKVLVLPYQVNGDSSKASLRQDVPNLLAQRLSSQGVDVLSSEQVASLLQSENLKTIDISTARRLGAKAGVDTVVYGAFNQLGNGFTLDSRIVPISSNQNADVVITQKQNMLELAAAADDLASRVSGQIRQDSGPILLGAPSAPNNVNPQPTRRATLPVPVGGNIQKGALRDIQVVGLRIMDPDAVLMRLSLRPGDLPDPALINEEVKRIWDMGYFSDVQSQLTAGPVLVFNVIEKPRIDAITVEGSDEIDEEDILATMSTKTGAVLNEKILSDDIQKIKELYRKEGYYLADVRHRVLGNTGNANARLVLTVVEGDEIYISEVKINGLKNLDQGDIEGYMALRPRNFLSWITGTGVLEEENLERDSNAIAAYGLNEGYVDIQVAAPDVQYTKDGIVITFNVDEGRRFKVKEVKFGGQLIEDEEKLKSLISMDEQKADSEYFSLSVMQEDAKKIKEFYGDQGYAFAEVEPKIMKDEGGDATITVGYFVNKKQKVYIRRVMLEGNDRTRDNVLLREMRLADGDMYQGAKMRRSTERLNRLGYFTSVDVELVPTEVAEEVDLKVKVKEGKTGAAMAGVGYSTFYDVGVSASIMERNLLGRGYWLQIQGFTSVNRTSGVLSFTNPRLFDTNLLVGNDLYYTFDQWDSFSKTTLGDSIRVAYPIGEYTTIGLSYRLEQYILDNIYEYSAPSIREYEGENWTSAITARIVRDTTDNRTRPTKGTIFRASVEYGGSFLGGTDNFVKANVDWQGFYALDKKGDHVLRLRTRAGGVFQNTDSIIPVFERFYVGGIDTIRGFDYTHISPRDKTYGDVIGGDRMAIVNLEYMWNFQKDLGMAIVPFIDAGFNIDSDYMQVYDHIVATAGLELRWRSPMGDLRIAYGIPLTEDYSGRQQPGRFEFTMGHQF